jgi:hypothetical protein
VGFAGDERLQERVLLWPVTLTPETQEWLVLTPDDQHHFEILQDWILRRDMLTEGYPARDPRPILQFSEMVDLKELTELVVAAREDARAERVRRKLDPHLGNDEPRDMRLWGGSVMAVPARGRARASRQLCSGRPGASPRRLTSRGSGLLAEAPSAHQPARLPPRGIWASRPARASAGSRATSPASITGASGTWLP